MVSRGLFTSTFVACNNEYMSGNMHYGVSLVRTTVYTRIGLFAYCLVVINPTKASLLVDPTRGKEFAA